MEIVPASFENIEGFHATLDEVARERKYLLMVEAPPLAEMESFVRRIIESQWTQFYAIEGDRVVGWCDVIPHARVGTCHVGSVGMGVVKSHRRKGIGEKLLSCSLNDAFKKGLKRVEMEVFSSNRPAISLYQKLGFQIEGTKKNARLLDGHFDDFIIMARFDSDAEQNESLKP